MDKTENNKIKIPTWLWCIIGFGLMNLGNTFIVLVGFFIVSWSCWRLLKHAVKQLQGAGKKATPVRRTLAEIDAMDGFEFEKYMKQVYESIGYSVHHTPLSGDQGADLILTSNEGVRTAVQLKRYSGTVSNKAVQEVVAAKGFHKCTQGMVVTNNYFTDSAKQLAAANNISLVDRTGLIKLLNESFNVMNEHQKNEYNEGFIGGFKRGLNHGLNERK